ncbi:hypothetical protein ACFW9X_41905, partial [Streptomyces sp. NPDC059466]
MASERDRSARPLNDLVEELLDREGPLPIVAAGNPVLRRPAEPFDGQLEPGLLSRFVAALRAPKHPAPGGGGAAPPVLGSPRGAGREGSRARVGLG